MQREDRRALAKEEGALGRDFDVVQTSVAVGSGSVELIHPRSADALVSEEEFVHDERLPYWADVWPASLVLAEHVAAMAGGGRRLLELGCGVGLVSACAARAGFQVTATDYYDDALRFARANVLRNSGIEPATLLADWRRFPRALGKFEVVVASDVLYELHYANLVAAVLSRTIAPSGIGLVADPGRVAAGLFVDECGRRGLQVRRTGPFPYAEGEIRQQITIYELTRPQLSSRT